MAFGTSLGAFADGFSASRDARKDREERAASAAMQDRMLDVMARQNEIMASRPVSYGALPDMGGATGFVSGPANSSSAPAGDGTLLSLIDRTEGGADYDTLFGHSQKGGPFAGTRVSQMTLGDLSSFSDPGGKYGQWVKGKVGHVATPMGRYQFVGTTMRDVARDMGLPNDTVFNRGTQDAMFQHLARKTLARGKTPSAKRLLLRGQWEGFKNVSDSELDAAIARFENGGRPMGARRPV